MSKKPRQSDNEDLRRSILLGLLLGGGTALTVSGLRTARLNKQLNKSNDPATKHDEDTVVVTVPKNRMSGMGKLASVPEVYKLTALAGAGIISYSALTALYKRLEDNRMKELEQQAYGKVVNKLVNNQEKSAQIISKTIDNFDPARNVLALLALIGAAAWTKKRLDRGNVDSEKLKTVKPEKVLFEAPGAKKASETKEAAADKDRKRAVTGKGVNNSTRVSIENIRRILHNNPEAENLLTSNVLDSAGYGKLNLLQNVPIVGKLMRLITLRQLGLGTFYRPGWDPKSKENSFRTRPSAAEGIKPSEMAARDVGKIRSEILGNKALRDSLVNMAADKKKLGGFARAYLRHNPEKLLDRLGIVPMKGKIVTKSDDTDFENSVAKSYFK